MNPDPNDNSLIYEESKMRVNLSLCLTKYQVMKTLPVLN